MMITIRMHCGIHRTVEAFIESMREAGYPLHKWSPSFEEPLSVLQFYPPKGDEAKRFCEALP
jgi:hypothetical protein